MTSSDVRRAPLGPESVPTLSLGDGRRASDVSLSLSFAPTIVHAKRSTAHGARRDRM